MSVKMDAAAIERFLADVFPQALEMGFTIDRVDEEGVTLGLVTGERHLRPGGTVMGPVLMTLADTAAYLVILSRVGPEALAVTTSLQLHFLQRPRPGALRARARLLKLGSRLAVVSVDIFAEGREGPVAHGTVTYARPSGDIVSAP